MSILPTKIPEYDLTLSNNVKVKYRPFLVKEEKVLLMAIENDNESEMIDTLIGTVQTCMITHSKFQVIQ